MVKSSSPRGKVVYDLKEDVEPSGFASDGNVIVVVVVCTNGEVKFPDLGPGEVWAEI